MKRLSELGKLVDEGEAIQKEIEAIDKEAKKLAQHDVPVTIQMFIGAAPPEPGTESVLDEDGSLIVGGYRSKSQQREFYEMIMGHRTFAFGGPVEKKTTVKIEVNIPAEVALSLLGTALAKKREALNEVTRKIKALTLNQK